MKIVNGYLVSADQDGKVCSWSKDFYASEFLGQPHSTSVTQLATYANALFSGSMDGTIKKSVQPD